MNPVYILTPQVYAIKFFSFHLCLLILSNLFLSNLETTMCVLLYIRSVVALHSHLIFLDSIFLTIFGEQKKVLNFSLCSFPFLPVTSMFLGFNYCPNQCTDIRVMSNEISNGGAV